MKFFLILIIGYITLVLLPISTMAAVIFPLASIILMIIAKKLADSLTQEQRDEIYSRESRKSNEDDDNGFKWSHDFDPFYSHELTNIHHDD